MKREQMLRRCIYVNDDEHVAIHTCLSQNRIVSNGSEVCAVRLMKGIEEDRQETKQTKKKRFSLDAHQSRAKCGKADKLTGIRPLCPSLLFVVDSLVAVLLCGSKHAYKTKVCFQVSTVPKIDMTD